MKHRIIYLLISILPGVLMASKDVHYTLRFENPHTHLIDVSVEVTGLTGEYHDFYMPVWTPGSYLVREFSRNVITFNAHKKTTPLTVEKQNKNTWRVYLNGNSTIAIEYQIYAFEYTVRTSFVDQDMAFLNGASIFVLPEGYENRKIRVSLEPHMSWEKITTELPKYKGDHFSYVANDLDHLIDSPILLGNQRTVTFNVLDVPHEIAFTDTGNYDLDKVIDDTRKVIESAQSIFGGLPYDHYTFFLCLTDGGYGGLEHKNSCSLIWDPWKFSLPTDYLKFMGLVSHEYFHVFNVKRIRPAQLGPFDYQAENYTDLLWISEGFTAYYDNHILRRTGIATSEEYLNLLAEDILKLDGTPGRQIQSVAESSFDAWIKLYRSNENSVNSTVSYYLKGSQIGLILDLQIRHLTSGKSSLDDVFRQLWKDYSKTGDGFTETDFIAACEGVAGNPLTDIWNIVHGVEEINFNDYLESFGLRLEKEYSDEKDKNHAWFGMKFNNVNLKVKQVLTDSPAFRDGINVNDELIAIGDIRLTDENAQKHLDEAPKDKPSTLTISRRGIMRTIQITPAESPENKYKIVKIENPEEEKKNLYSIWLHDIWESESPAKIEN